MLNAKKLNTFKPPPWHSLSNFSLLHSEDGMIIDTLNDSTAADESSKINWSLLNKKDEHRQDLLNARLHEDNRLI